MPMMMSTWAEWISGNESHNHESVCDLVFHGGLASRRSRVPVRGQVFNTDCQMTTTWVVSTPVAEQVCVVEDSVH